LGQRHHRHRHFLQLSRTLPPLSLLQAAQEEYDPEENLDVPAVTRLSSGSYDYDDPAAQAAPDTPPGVSKLSPRSPDASDAEDSDGEHESGRGRASERERSQSQSVQNGPVNLRYQAGAGVGVGAAAAAAASGGDGPFSIDAVVRNTAAALDALTNTARLTDESWYMWGEAGEARLAAAKQFAQGLLSNDLLALLRDGNVATELRWRLTMERDADARAAQQAETPRPAPSQQQPRAGDRPPGVVVGGAGGGRPMAAGGALPARRQAPGVGYVCNICGIAGHWIADCPRKQSTQASAGGPGAGTSGVRRGTPRPPPNGYVCNACKIPGHWIQVRKKTNGTASSPNLLANNDRFQQDRLRTNAYVRVN
jgi:hypothetical protein